MKVQNYNSECKTCNALQKDEHVIYEGKLVAWVPYPRWNANPFRSALVPKRHLGEDGKYGLAKLSNEEREELGSMETSVTNAIISATKDAQIELETRDGMPLIDRLVRTATHPNIDFVPQTKQPAKFAGYIFPRYLDAGIGVNSANIKKTAKVIVASFADAPLKPEDLIEEEVRLLKKYFNF
jgi:hypothetical protein